MARSTLLLILVVAVLVGGAVLIAGYDESDPSPGAAVSDNEGTRVEAPGTTVESDRDKTRIQAPGVDITVPKDRDGE